MQKKLINQEFTINQNCFHTNKQKRAYRGILNGMEIAQRQNKRIRFLTLTTSDIESQLMHYNNLTINNDFRKLKQRIKRMTVAKLIKDKYIKTSDARRYYPNQPLTKQFDFEYFKVKTNEGNGVLHTLYKGQYLPYNYLVDNWQDIHNTWDLNIKLVNNTKNDFKKASNYVVTHYLSNQGTTYERSSQSWQWTIRAYNKEFYKFIEKCKSQFYYNPILKRFYKDKQEVNIFKLWMKELIVLTKSDPPKQFLLSKYLTEGVAI